LVRFQCWLPVLDASDAAAPRAAPRAPWTVGALLLATSELLAARLGAVAVRGELSGFTRAASGHCYFSLKDAAGAPALLRCAMFRRAAALLDFRPADGQQVEVRGRLGVYDARGELQLVVEHMQRVGAGTLYEEFLRLKARLEAQGIGADVVSMVCTELFDEQPAAYRADILPADALIVSVEAASTFGWQRYTGTAGLNIGLDTFGASAPAGDLFAHFGFTAEAIVPQILNKLNDYIHWTIKLR
jgi:exodeoxyribonuclease VII large subunit